jgi:hypothetical protein
MPVRTLAFYKSMLLHYLPSSTQLRTAPAFRPDGGDADVDHGQVSEILVIDRTMTHHLA